MPAEVARERILTYLAQRRQAMATAEGIAQCCSFHATDDSRTARENARRVFALTFPSDPTLIRATACSVRKIRRILTQYPCAYGWLGPTAMLL